MLHSLKLLLPALIPSWRFFDVIAPSPRIEFALLKSPQETVEQWHAFRPRPARLSFTSMVCCLFWNPGGNETLFLVSCAERLIEDPTEHSQQEIRTRIITALEKNMPAAGPMPYLQFRLVFISRHGTALHEDIRFVSPVYPYARDAAS